jgi:hypothetical protein
MWQPPAPAPLRWRAVYVALLGGAFAFFNTVRLATYLPTLWTIHESGQSDQHSLVTWASWMLANLSTALWLVEKSGRVDGVAALSFGNALMCAAVLLLIACYRF